MEPAPYWSLIHWEPRSGSVRRSAFFAILTGSLVLAAVVPLVRCLASAVLRIRYPFDLDWMESGVVSYMQVIRSGGQIYRAPSLEFTPYVYPPLYFYVSTVVSWVVGLGQLAPRLVSFASFIGCLILLARWVETLTADRVAGIVAAGIFTATYGTTEYWFDLARVDSFFLVQLLGGVAILRSATTVRRVALGAALLATACFTKQVGLPFAAVALAWLFLVSWRFALVGGAVFATLVLAMFVLFAATSDGWFQYYVLYLPSHQAVAWERWEPAAREYLWGALAPLSVAQTAFACRVGLGSMKDRDWLLQNGLAFVSVGTSLAQFLHIGGYVNGFIPSYAIFAVAFGIELAALRRARPSFHAGSQVFALVAVIAQCALVWYPAGASPPDIPHLIRSPVPTEIDRAVGEKAVEEIGHLPRPVWVLCNSDIARVAGQPALFTNTMGLSDVMKGGGTQARRLHALLERAIAGHHFKTIVLDRAGGFLPFDLVDAIRANYRRAGTVLPGAPDTAFWPRSGAWVRPDEIWVAP